jgi:hypothetical protein
MLLAGQLPDRDFLQNAPGASDTRRLYGSGKLRKRRKTGLFLRGSLDLAKQRDWLVEDAVSSEPVSGTNSLVTGKNTGNFTILPL